VKKLGPCRFEADLGQELAQSSDTSLRSQVALCQPTLTVWARHYTNPTPNLPEDTQQVLHVYLPAARELAAHHQGSPLGPLLRQCLSRGNAAMTNVYNDVGNERPCHDAPETVVADESPLGDDRDSCRLARAEKVQASTKPALSPDPSDVFGSSPNDHHKLP
jgi:hypothetical protein